MTPLLPMYTLGHDFVPPPVHAGGLRYHGDAPSLSGLVKEGVIEAKAIQQTAAFDAAVRFAQVEGIIPGRSRRTRFAPRSTTRRRRPAGRRGCGDPDRALSGHGHFDMSAYQAFLAGEPTDLEFSEEDMATALEHLFEAPH